MIRPSRNQVLARANTARATLLDPVLPTTLNERDEAVALVSHRLLQIIRSVSGDVKPASNNCSQRWRKQTSPRRCDLCLRIRMTILSLSPIRVCRPDCKSEGSPYVLDSPCARKRYREQGSGSGSASRAGPAGSSGRAVAPPDPETQLSESQKYV